MRGLFISIEGMDGSGKTTQIKLLSDYLVMKGKEVIVTREPGGDPISEKIRELLLDKENELMIHKTEALLYAGGRAQHVEKVIRPALKGGKIVICDRYIDSSLAYQGYARGLGIDKIEEINLYATSGLMPHITFLLEISEDRSILRKKNQKEFDRIEMENMDFHKRVREGYQVLKERYKDRIRLINSDQDPVLIHREILHNLEEFDL